MGYGGLEKDRDGLIGKSKNSDSLISKVFWAALSTEGNAWPFFVQPP